MIALAVISVIGLLGFAVLIGGMIHAGNPSSERSIRSMKTRGPRGSIVDLVI